MAIPITHRVHSPGLWKCGDGEPFVYALNDAGTNRFFLTVGAGWITGPKNQPNDERTPEAELIANARLIAAAPDLLEALKNSSAALQLAMSLVPDGGNCAYDMIALEAQIRLNNAAIAKATAPAA